MVSSNSCFSTGGVFENSNKDEIIYKLTIEDIQQVATRELDRELTREEIKRHIDPIAEKISWYDSITNVINEVIAENDE